jgi:hypothetical protein
MSALDRLFRRGQTKTAEVVGVMHKMTEEEIRAKRLALWKEIQENPTPERAAQIATEANALLDHFGREHPMRDNVTELIRAAERLSGKERLVL